MKEEIRRLKSEIEAALSVADTEQAGGLIEKYKAINPYDMDLVTYLCLYSIYSGNYEDAIMYGQYGVRHYPVNGEISYNLGSAYECSGDILHAVYYYQRADYLFAYEGTMEQYDTGDRLAALWGILEKEVNENPSDELIKAVQNLLEWKKNCYGLSDLLYRSMKPIEEFQVWAGTETKLGVGLYRMQCLDGLPATSFNVVQSRFEFMPVKESRSCSVPDDCEEYLLPISVSKDKTLHCFVQGGEQFDVRQELAKCFNYYRVKGGTKVASTETSYYGTPIPLGHDSKRKKLVLNIFVDGLSQTILDNMKEVMPSTYDFFSKGMVCKEARSTAEWTYPSLAAYNTGMDTVHHVMFHSGLVTALPHDITTLAEYFHDQGYVTSKIDGDWRSTADYGYYRGYSRMVYQEQVISSKNEMIIGDVIDQIEAFDDTDQFVWICLGDLHDIADGFDLTLSVQNHLPIEARTIDSEGNTSVKQPFSEKKITAYKEMAARIDALLSALYAYLERKFSDDEMVVSLFADHGQGYLVPTGSHFLSDERTKVAFMFRGGDLSAGFTDELISTVDYLPIMCSLAGIPLKENEEIQGRLPKSFGGEKERDYTLTESLHPGDPYQAEIVTKSHRVFFTNGSEVRNDGRFELQNYSIKVETKDGKQLHDTELERMYTELVLDHVKMMLIYG